MSIKFKFEFKQVPAVFLDGWLVKLEKKAFGWEYIGSHSERTEWDEQVENTSGEWVGDVYVRTTERHTERRSKITTYKDFSRITPYSFNIIFHIFEFLSGIISFVRRFVMYLVDLALVLFAILGAIAVFGGGEDIGTFVEGIGAFLLLYVICIVVPSLLIALFAWLMRKLFKIDEHVEQQLIDNGYTPDWREEIHDKFDE